MNANAAAGVLLEKVSHEEIIMGESSQLSLAHFTPDINVFYVASKLAGMHLQHKFQRASTGIIA